MHSKLAIMALALGIFVQIGLCAKYNEAEAHKLFMEKCSTCHGVEDYDLGSRSLKEWQLIVERMASYGGADPYSDEEGDTIIAYLYGETYKSQNDPPTYQYGVDDVTPATTQPDTQPAATTQPVKPKIRISWKKSKTLWIAKDMGYIATAILVLMIGTGLARKKLKRNFKRIHTVLAILLFGSLAIHVAVYLCEYGAPSKMWLWSGILASILIGLVEFGGLMRARLGVVKFIKLHSICGVVGLVLVLVHWFWTPVTYWLMG